MHNALFFQSAFHFDSLQRNVTQLPNIITEREEEEREYVHAYINTHASEN